MKSLSALLLLVTIFLSPVRCISQNLSPESSKTVYQSDALTVTQLTEDVYVHTSFLQTETFGKVACNGMIVTNQNEAVVFDTPADDSSSAELIAWIRTKLHCKINAVIPTHFHEDCVGGLKEFHENNIPSYANQKTIELAKERGFNIPAMGFKNSLKLDVGGENVHAGFFGEGHTRDNIVGYFPAGKVLFGGCLVKELNASKGNLADANVNDWGNTVKSVKARYPDVKFVIPGHGAVGGSALLDYTIKLFDRD